MGGSLITVNHCNPACQKEPAEDQGLLWKGVWADENVKCHTHVPRVTPCVNCAFCCSSESVQCNVTTRWELVSKGNIMDLSAHPHGPVFPHCSSPIPPLPLMPPASFVSTKPVSWSFHFLLLLLSSSSPTLVHPAQRFRSTSEPRRMKRLLCRCICIFFTC